LILYSGKADFSSNSFVGNVMIFFNALSYGIYLVTIKPLMLKYHPATVMKWVFVFGFIFVFPITVGKVAEVNWRDMPMHIYMAIMYVVVFTTFLAYLLNVYGLKRLNASTVSIYIYSQPIIASIVSVILGKDQLTFVKITSTILVFIGVYLVSVRQSKKIITTK
jgi:drug/metabolite transporter (DMT)-like permease